jgi:hypothetical protein
MHERKAANALLCLCFYNAKRVFQRDGFTPPTDAFKGLYRGGNTNNNIAGGGGVSSFLAPAAVQSGGLGGGATGPAYALARPPPPAASASTAAAASSLLGSGGSRGGGGGGGGGGNMGLMTVMEVALPPPPPTTLGGGGGLGLINGVNPNANLKRHHATTVLPFGAFVNAEQELPSFANDAIHSRQRRNNHNRDGDGRFNHTCLLLTILTFLCGVPLTHCVFLRKRRNNRNRDGRR